MHVESAPGNDTDIVITPSEYSTMGELTALMGSASDNSPSGAETRKKPWILISIIASTFFLGFRIGFSLGYYTLEKGMLKITAMRGGGSQNLAFDNIEG